mgnify:CR=1 FL=1
MTLTPKQDAFCMVYVETGNATEAYRCSYSVDNMKPATVNRRAKDLMDNGKIQARIKELQAEHRERHAVTVDSLTDEYEEARGKALEIGQPGAAVSATTGKARLHGLGQQEGPGLAEGAIMLAHILKKIDGGTRDLVDVTPKEKTLDLTAEMET